MADVADRSFNSTFSSGRPALRDRTALVDTAHRAESLKRSNDDMRMRIMQVWRPKRREETGERERGKRKQKSLKSSSGVLSLRPTAGALREAEGEGEGER